MPVFLKHKKQDSARFLSVFSLIKTLFAPARRPRFISYKKAPAEEDNPAIGFTGKPFQFKYRSAAITYNKRVTA